MQEISKLKQCNEVKNNQIVELLQEASQIKKENQEMRQKTEGLEQELLLEREKLVNFEKTFDTKLDSQLPGGAEKAKNKSLKRKLEEVTQA